MKTAICASILFFVAPALGVAAEPASLPSPPPVTYDVWGFRWDGRQYVKQAANCLSTTDLKQAADYSTQITSYAGWLVTTNMPSACVVHTTFRGPVISVVEPADFPAKPTYTVWAFRNSQEAKPCSRSQHLASPGSAHRKI